MECRRRLLLVGAEGWCDTVLTIGKTDFLWKYTKVIGWELRAALRVHITFVNDPCQAGLVSAVVVGLFQPSPCALRMQRRWRVYSVLRWSEVRRVYSFSSQTKGDPHPSFCPLRGIGDEMLSGCRAGSAEKNVSANPIWPHSCLSTEMRRIT